ncbi:hypothetical protein Glove_42g42 [Diversispora epigaea]|uniref:Uncharacterized protein n=1 Tax=Diversispora epigaea TaxID=1348612 RepID=A0A397JR23_9GLOM|nr:hypothetical protein Glove_42g42 [Diversispora epigaea]
MRILKKYVPKNKSRVYLYEYVYLYQISGSSSSINIHLLNLFVYIKYQPIFTILDVFNNFYIDNNKI